MKPVISKYKIYARHNGRTVDVGEFESDALGNAINLARKKHPELSYYTFYEPKKDE